ncbi:MAG: hypothetical protein WBG88_00385 [Mesorhizobium sp.]
MATSFHRRRCLAEKRLSGMFPFMMRTVQIAALAALAGCASAKQPETSCATLNREIGNNSKGITTVALNRGKTDSLNVPFWVPGGAKAISVIKGRQTGKIEKLQSEQSTMLADRRRECP